MHTNSTYPCPVEELNLNYIKWLKNKWKSKAIGYSGHEYGLVSTFAAVALGVEWVEGMLHLITACGVAITCLLSLLVCLS